MRNIAYDRLMITRIKQYFYNWVDLTLNRSMKYCAYLPVETKQWNTCQRVGYILLYCYYVSRLTNNLFVFNANTYSSNKWWRNTFFSVCVCVPVYSLSVRTLAYNNRIWRVLGTSQTFVFCRGVYFMTSLLHNTKLKRWPKWSRLNIPTSRPYKRVYR